MSLLMHDTLSRFRRIRVGGGAELMTACDLRVIDESATVRFVQVRMGVIPGWQGATRLASLVGRNNALRLLASAKPMSGADCLKVGLADEVAMAPIGAPEKALSMLDSWTTSNEGGYPVAIRGVKKVISRFDMEDGGFLDAQLAFERKVFGGLWGAKTNVEALTNSMKKKSSPPISSS
ncbi:ClpP/crotonase-like domain-containing protein [Chytridium lagenaria]|nr:ClpP/crotonase-like domain-containing protein [Chytridium lagenaria]